MATAKDKNALRVMGPPGAAGVAHGIGGPHEYEPIPLDGFIDEEALVRDKGYALGPHKLHVYQTGVRKVAQASWHPPGAFAFGQRLSDHVKFAISFASKEKQFQIHAESMTSEELRVTLFVGWSDGQGALFTMPAAPAGALPTVWTFLSSELAILSAIDILAPAGLLLGEFFHDPFR
jgi:hypothetical protein